MLSIEELGHIPLFSGLHTEHLQHLANNAADIHLAAGEYVVHEGEERALFVVLSGKIEIAKSIDGVERILGARAPGTFFGEVPITLGTPFPVSFRAAEP